jgi:hypothetical protein
VLLSANYLNVSFGSIANESQASRKWIGPFEVVQVLGPVAYELKTNPDWRVYPVFHVSLLQLYKAAGYNAHLLPLRLKARSSMRWNCF